MTPPHSPGWRVRYAEAYGAEAVAGGAAAGCLGGYDQRPHRVPHPFALRRQSGYGIGGIRPTMDEMSEEKMLVFRHADLSGRFGRGTHVLDGAQP
jgi:hypothetical protein